VTGILISMIFMMTEDKSAGMENQIKKRKNAGNSSSVLRSALDLKRKK
jgi:hypothetical protein